MGPINCVSQHNPLLLLLFNTQMSAQLRNRQQAPAAVGEVIGSQNAFGKEGEDGFGFHPKFGRFAAPLAAEPPPNFLGSGVISRQFVAPPDPGRSSAAVAIGAVHQFHGLLMVAIGDD